MRGIQIGCPRRMRRCAQYKNRCFSWFSRPGSRWSRRIMRNTVEVGTHDVLNRGEPVEVGEVPWVDGGPSQILDQYGEGDEPERVEDAVGSEQACSLVDG